MDKTDTRKLLQLRRQLTGEPFSDETVDAWHRALAHDDGSHAIAAMNRAARSATRVTIHDLIEAWPRTPEPMPRREPTGEEISLDEYLRRLQRRVDAGSVDARRELAAWRKMTRRP